MELTLPSSVVTGRPSKCSVVCKGKAREVSFSLLQILTLKEDSKVTKVTKVIAKATVHENVSTRDEP